MDVLSLMTLEGSVYLTDTWGLKSLLWHHKHYKKKTQKHRDVQQSLLGHGVYGFTTGLTLCHNIAVDRRVQMKIFLTFCAKPSVLEQVCHYRGNGSSNRKRSCCGFSQRYVSLHKHAHTPGCGQHYSIATAIKQHSIHTNSLFWNCKFSSLHCYLNKF